MNIYSITKFITVIDTLPKNGIGVCTRTIRKECIRSNLFTKDDLKLIIYNFGLIFKEPFQIACEKQRLFSTWIIVNNNNILYTFEPKIKNTGWMRIVLTNQTIKIIEAIMSMSVTRII
jgi:hypothetical protein